MKLIIFIDEDRGYSFNHRRLSRDKKLRLHMMNTVRNLGGVLFMNRYSEQSFLKDEGVFLPQERNARKNTPAAQGTAFLEDAKQADGWAFVENEDVSPYLPDMEEMLVYSWGRRYLSDLRLPANYADGYTEQYTESIAGASHEKVRLVHYIRKAGE